MNEPTKYYDAGNNPDKPDWWSFIIDRIERRQEWAIVHMRRENEYEVWAEGKHYDTRKTLLGAEKSMQDARREARRNNTSYTASSTETLVVEKEQTKGKPTPGIILIPLLTGGVAGGISAILAYSYQGSFSGLLSCGLGFLYILLIVIAGFIAARYSGYGRSGAIAGVTWSVIIIISSVVRFGRGITNSSLLPIALALLIGGFLGLVGGAFGRRE